MIKNNNKINTIGRSMVILSSIIIALVVVNCSKSSGGGGSSSKSGAGGLGGEFGGLPTIAAGKEHTLLIKKNGTLLAFGANASGQLGLGDTKNRDKPTPVTTDVVSVAVGDAYSLILKKDGSVLSFGSNNFGQLGVDKTDKTFAKTSQETKNTPTPVPGLDKDVIAIVAGSYHSLVIKKDHSLWAFGSNEKGQLGVADNIGSGNSKPALVPDFDKNVQAVAAGDEHTLVLTTDGSLYTFGGNESAQLGRDTKRNPDSKPTLLKDFEKNVKFIAAAYAGSFVVRNDNTVYAFGINDETQLGLDAFGGGLKPEIVKDIGIVKAISAGVQHTLIIKADDTVWAFGRGADDRLGFTITGPNIQSALQITAIDKKVSEISAGFSSSLVKDVDGNFWIFGDQAKIGLGLTATTPTKITIP